MMTCIIIPIIILHIISYIININYIHRIKTCKKLLIQKKKCYKKDGDVIYIFQLTHILTLLYTYILHIYYLRYIIIVLLLLYCHIYYHIHYLIFVFDITH